MSMEDSKKPRRKPITKKLRFEVFKRDGFTCQYCGRMAPDVILEVDHINPVANGGDNDIINLITSCRDCNRGKGKRTLSSREELKIQQDQLKELSKKREQLQMLVDWRKELSHVNDMQVDAVDQVLESGTGLVMSEQGRKIISKYIERFGLNQVCEAMQVYVDSYFDQSTRNFSKDFGVIGGICYNKERQKTDPSLYWVNKVAYAVNKKYFYVEKWKVREIVSGKIHSEEQLEQILELVDESQTWGDLKRVLLEVI